MRLAKPLITIGLCAAAQLCALVVGHRLWTWDVGFLGTLLGACVTAALISFLAKARTEIILLNALFPLAVVFSFSDEISGHTGLLTLAMAAFLLLLFAPTLYSGVPYYPTHRKVYEAISTLLPTDRQFEFIDLGCGDGRLIAYLARRFPLGHFRGCELSPLAWLFATLRCAPYRKRVKIEFADMWSFDVSKADVVYNFLAPPVMARLWMKLSTETRPDALLVSNAFEFPVSADRYITFDGDLRSRLALYGRSGKESIT